jgi:hypothetical protein
VKSAAWIVSTSFASRCSTGGGTGGAGDVWANNGEASRNMLKNAFIFSNLLQFKHLTRADSPDFICIV